MTYYDRFHELSSQFVIGQNVRLSDSKLRISFYSFQSEQADKSTLNCCESTVLQDGEKENAAFQYPVFFHDKQKKYQELILLLHGLNERSWTKYLPWAEYLCKHTGKAVLLFPIAYHVNRTPANWSNPRFLHKLLDLRRKLIGQDRSMSVANVALSERLSENPHRFYQSGKQSYHDIVRLITDIQAGKHPLFNAKTKVDVFAYSIGAFLSQVLFLSNPNEIFSDSKLFMFCGGSIFSSMYGESRSIMDKKSYEKLVEYYQTGFWAEKIAANTGDDVMAAFYSMLTPENDQTKRIALFGQMKQRISGISLAMDKVIPYHGVVEALGHASAFKTITLLDLPYDYSHESPFPVTKQVDIHEVDKSFLQVFKHAAGFLGN